MRRCAKGQDGNETLNEQAYLEPFDVAYISLLSTFSRWLFVHYKMAVSCNLHCYSRMTTLSRDREAGLLPRVNQDEDIISPNA